MDCCCRSCSTAWTPPVAPFSTHYGAVQARRPSAETRGATSRPSLQPCASSGCRAGSAGAHSFPQTGAEQGYPHPAYFSTPNAALWSPDASALLANNIVTQIVDG